MSKRIKYLGSKIMFNFGLNFTALYSIVSNFSIRGGGALLEMFFVILVANKLGLENSSKYFVAYSVFLVMVAFSRGGADFKVVRDISRSCKVDNQYEIRTTILESFFKVIVYSLMVFLLARFLDSLGFFDYFIGKDSARILNILIWAIMPVALILLSSEIFRGYGRIQFSQLIYSWVILGPTILWVCLQETFTAIDLVRFYVASSYCVFLIVLFFVLRRINFKKKGDFRLNILMLRFDFFFLIRIAILISAGLPIWIINFFGDESVGLFIVANRFAMGVTLALVAIEASAGPKFARMYGNDTINMLCKSLRDTQYMAFMLSVIVGVVLVFFSSLVAEYLSIESEKNFTIISGILIIGYIVNGYFAPIGTFFQMTFNEKLALYAYLKATFFGFFILVFLLTVFGAVGLAVGCVLVFFIRGLELNKMYIKKFEVK